MFGGWNKGQRCQEDMESQWERMQEERKAQENLPI